MSTSKEVDPTVYLEICFKPQSADRAIKEFPLAHIHRFFAQKQLTSSGGEPVKVLDYGCGPVVAYDISAAGINAEIVLAEYGAKCRSALNEWIQHSPTAWDWLPYIKHVVQNIEGKDEREAIKREDSLRKAIKAVVACDISKDPPIAEGYEGPYDVVMSMLCIESGCLTRDDYRAAVKRIATLVKQGGNLLLYSTIRNREDNDQTPGYYTVGKQRHDEVALPLEFVLKTLQENGLTVNETNVLPEEIGAALYKPGLSDLESTAFIMTTKST